MIPSAIILLCRYQHLAPFKLTFKHSLSLLVSISTSSYGSKLPQSAACAAGERPLPWPLRPGAAAGVKQRGEAARAGRRESGPAAGQPWRSSPAVGQPWRAVGRSPPGTEGQAAVGQQEEHASPRSAVRRRRAGTGGGARL